MATPFKLKSGNASAFKNLGSSPLKQGGDNLKRIMSEKKAIAKKTGTFYAPGAEPKVNKGSMPKNFNTTGSKGSTTPGYKSTKAAKTAKVKAFKEFDKWHKTLKKSPSVISKHAAKVGKFLGGKALGVAGMMMATSSKADQPTKGKGKTEYPGGKIDFTKKK